MALGLKVTYPGDQTVQTLGLGAENYLANQKEESSSILLTID